MISSSCWKNGEKSNFPRTHLTECLVGFCALACLLSALRMSLTQAFQLAGICGLLCNQHSPSQKTERSSLGYTFNSYLDDLWWIKWPFLYFSFRDIWVLSGISATLQIKSTSICSQHWGYNGDIKHTTILQEIWWQKT